MFRDNLKKYRSLNNLTQDDLANKLFISRTLVTKWESGSVYPTKEHIFKLSNILNISIKKLLSRQEIRQIFYITYKTKPIEKMLLFISFGLFIVSATLFVFSYILENTLSNSTNINKLVPPTRIVLLIVFMLAFLILVIEILLRRKLKYKHMFENM